MLAVHHVRVGMLPGKSTSMDEEPVETQAANKKTAISERAAVPKLHVGQRLVQQLARPLAVAGDDVKVVAKRIHITLACTVRTSTARYRGPLLQ